MKVLFLDVDGVLNGHEPMENGYCGIKPECVSRLNRILRAVPDAKIVVHSAWRYLLYEGNLPIRFFENLLLTHGVDCFGRLAGRTRWDGVNGWVPTADDLKERADQIREYVAEHGVECFAVLDDLELQIENFVRTDGDVGLTDADANAVIRLLTKSMWEAA